MSELSQAPRLMSSDGREIIITGVLTFGRSPECTVQLQDALVSRQHAGLELADQKVILTDLGSRNGTWVNKDRVTAPVELHNGDRIRIGKTVYIFKAAQGTSVPQTAADGAPVGTAQTLYWQTGIPMTLVRSDTGAEFGLNRSISLGRDESNDLALKDDTSASGAHARIELVGGQAVVMDQKSSNGTWVNGRRIQGPTALRHGDRLRVGNAMFRLRVGERPLPPLDAAAQARKSKGQKWVWPVVGVGILVFCVLAVILGVVLGLPAIEKGMQTSAREKALHALVVVVVPVQGTDLTSSGSGSLLNEDGYVLTNYHVIADPDTRQYYNNDGLVYIGLNWNDPQAEPDTFYQCRVVDVNEALDLALLQVKATNKGGALPADLVFPYIRVGDSNSLKVEDQITIIGFPTTGGVTATITYGRVSGFYPDGNIDKGWIKTDAEISGGNSGGMAINQSGELIGVPTIVVTGERTLGKIGYVRPIELAMSLIRKYLP
jgi:pSer/pThr/pTyr-binding forkhead associated (FHA) protein